MTTESPFSLAGKVAVVTGGSSGIGAASVRLLAAAGARVVVGYNKGADRAAALIAELPGSGHQAMYLPLEDSAQIRKVAAAVKDGFGRADILVNSAGFTRMVAHSDLEALDDDLIDAVDVDGDGRAELLFHEVSDTGSAFVVYRVIGNQLYPLFQGSLGE